MRCRNKNPPSFDPRCRDLGISCTTDAALDFWRYLFVKKKVAEGLLRSKIFMLSNDRNITVNHNFAPHHKCLPPFEAKRWSQKLRASAAA